MTTEVISQALFSDMLKCNEDAKRQTGTPLLDFDLIRKLGAIKAGHCNKEEVETALPPLREGVKEILVDIFNMKKYEVLEDGTHVDITKGVSADEGASSLLEEAK